MADLTTPDLTSERIDVDSDKAILKSLEAAGKRRFAAFNLSTMELENADDVAGLLNVGEFIADESGRTDDNFVGDGSKKYVIHTNRERVDQAIGGVSALTDRFKLVYPTDNSTLTITKPAAGNPIGFTKLFKSSGVADMHLFSLEAAFMMQLMGAGAERENLGQVSSIALEGTSAIDLMTFSLPYKGKITAFYATLVHKDAGVVAGSQALNLDIGGTPLTGGVLTLAFGDAQGARVDSTAITALNTFTKDQAIKLQLAGGGTGFTAAQDSIYQIFVEVEHLV